MTKRQDGFIHGRGGVITCLSCGQQTRETNETFGTEMCPICYRIGGLQNALSDGDIDHAEFKELVYAIKGFDPDVHIDNYTKALLEEGESENA